MNGMTSGSLLEAELDLFRAHRDGVDFLYCFPDVALGDDGVYAFVIPEVLLFLSPPPPPVATARLAAADLPAASFDSPLPLVLDVIRTFAAFLSRDVKRTGLLFSASDVLRRNRNAVFRSSAVFAPLLLSNRGAVPNVPAELGVVVVAGRLSWLKRRVFAKLS